MGSRKSSSKWNSLFFFFFSNTIIPQRTRKISIKQIRKGTNKAQSQQNEGNIKITVEMHKRLNKTLVENINETRSWSFETVTEIDK